MSTHLPGFQSFSAFSHYFVLTKSSTSSLRVNNACSSQEQRGNFGEIHRSIVEKRLQEKLEADH